MMSAAKMSQAKTLVELLLGFECSDAVANIEVANVALNSQLIQQGDVFLALQGVNRHGMDFCLNADKSQAAIVLYDSDDVYAKERLALLSKQMTTPLLGVTGLNKRYGEVLSRFNNDPSERMTMIAVTGTDGKTSVTHLLVQAFSRLGLNVGSIGTLGIGINNDLSANTHTTPDAAAIQSHLADFYQQGCSVVVMEVSSHALQQYRVVGCEFDVAIFTNLGSDHLDYHQTIESYGAAKARLFHWDSLKASVLNQDDEFVSQLADTLDMPKVMSFSASSMAKTDELTIQTSHDCVEIHNQLIGDFNVENILAVVSTLDALDYDDQQITLACNDLMAIPGRMQVIASATTQVIVDFAHTSQALQASLIAAKKQAKGKLICVFGCGGDRDSSKRPLMGAIAEQYADVVIITDDNPRYEDANKITDDILKGCKQSKKHQVIHDRKKAIECAIEQAKNNDSVLIAGKGHEDFQLINDQKIAFSDQAIAAEILQVMS